MAEELRVGVDRGEGGRSRRGDRLGHRERGQERDQPIVEEGHHALVGARAPPHAGKLRGVRGGGERVLQHRSLKRRLGGEACHQRRKGEVRRVLEGLVPVEGGDQSLRGRDGLHPSRRNEGRQRVGGGLCHVRRRRELAAREPVEVFRPPGVSLQRALRGPPQRVLPRLRSGRSGRGPRGAQRRVGGVEVRAARSPGARGRPSPGGRRERGPGGPGGAEEGGEALWSPRGAPLSGKEAGPAPAEGVVAQTGAGVAPGAVVKGGGGVRS